MTAAAPSRPKRSAVPKFLLSVPVDDDLTWFINHAESAQGQRSAHPALVAMIETGGQTRGRPSEVVTFSKGDEQDVDVEMSSADRRMMATHVRRAVGKASSLRQRWQRLGPGSQQVLVEAYAVRVFPHETKATLGQLAGVALLTRSIAGDGERLLGLCRKPGQNADDLDGIRRDAGELVRGALARWRLEVDGAADVEVFVAPPPPRAETKPREWAPIASVRGVWQSPREQMAKHAVAVLGRLFEMVTQAALVDAFRKAVESW